jgi:hypothetical protein
MSLFSIKSKKETSLGACASCGQPVREKDVSGQLDEGRFVHILCAPKCKGCGHRTLSAEGRCNCEPRCCKED